MVKFQQGNLSDMDVISCFVLASTENGINEIEFNRLIELRKAQVGEELVRLREDVLPEMSKQDFERQGRIYLLSQSENCSLVQASEIYEKLEQERNAEDKSDFGKIAKSMRTPKPQYDIEKLDEEDQKEEPQVEVLEWIPDAGTISRYNEIKRKLKEVK